jgi:hypothetical protein
MWSQCWERRMWLLPLLLQSLKLWVVWSVAQTLLCCLCSHLLGTEAVGDVEGAGEVEGIGQGLAGTGRLTIQAPRTSSIQVTWISPPSSRHTPPSSPP